MGLVARLYKMVKSPNKVSSSYGNCQAERRSTQDLVLGEVVEHPHLVHRTNKKNPV